MRVFAGIQRYANACSVVRLKRSSAACSGTCITVVFCSYCRVAAKSKGRTLRRAFVPSFTHQRFLVRSLDSCCLSSGLRWSTQHCARAENWPTRSPGYPRNDNLNVVRSAQEYIGNWDAFIGAAQLNALAKPKNTVSAKARVYRRYLPPGHYIGPPETDPASNAAARQRHTQKPGTRRSHPAARQQRACQKTREDATRCDTTFCSHRTGRRPPLLPLPPGAHRPSLPPSPPPRHSA
jgi:hypothetical protein